MKLTRGHKYGRQPDLPLLVVCAVQHALNCRTSSHPDSKWQRKARMRDLTVLRSRQLKQSSVQRAL